MEVFYRGTTEDEVSKLKTIVLFNIYGSFAFLLFIFLVQSSALLTHFADEKMEAQRDCVQNGYIICGAWCKMKTWGFFFKNY